MDTGKRINRLLFENHMEQKDLAEALNFTQASMSRWVKGTRIPKSEALCAIADYFDVSVDWLLGRSEYRNYNGFISGDDALEYCRKAKESAWKCWYKVANFDVTEISATSLANNTQACAYFEREILRWEYDIPRMIHSLADGTWKESEDRKTEPTISKMEQVDKDINVRSKDEPKAQTETQNSNLTFKTLEYCDICDHKGCKECIANALDEHCMPSQFKKQIEDECAKEYEELGLKKLKELIEADRKTEPQTDCTNCDQVGRCERGRAVECPLAERRE